MKLVSRRGSRWRLAPNMVLSRRFDPDEGADTVEHVESVLDELWALRREDTGPAASTA